MADSNKIETRYHYEYINNVFSSFYKSILDYFATYLQPRFEYKTVSTYDKAVEYLSKKDQYGREIDQPNLPALILNPSGEFGISDNGGMQFWRFPNLAPGLVKRLFYPIYQDSNVLVTVGFSRIKGEMEIITLVNSPYEYIDTKMLFLQIFGGFNRLIYPQWFHSYIIIPDELLNYTYYNEYTGQRYRLNWESAGATEVLVKSTNKNEIVCPVYIKPWFKLTSMSDGSTKYGGTDKLYDWRLISTIEYEVEMPSFVILESDYLAENINLSINFGTVFSAYPKFQPPANRELVRYHWDFGLDDTSNSTANYDTTSEIEYTKHLVFNTRYYHVVTELEAESITDVDISLPETIEDPDYLLVNSKNGILLYGDHYLITDNGDTLRIKVDNVTLTAGQIIELYVYKDEYSII